MAGSMSDYLEAAVLDDIFGISAFTVPDPVYLALFTAAPSDSGGGTEVTGGSYVRLSITNDGTEWSRATSTVDNDNELDFVEATASWGTIVAFGIFDASTSGNLLWWGDLAASKVIASGETARIKIGEIDVTLD